MKSKEFRKTIADAFVKSLKENPKTWKKTWTAPTLPLNGSSKRRYSGFNVLWLQHRMQSEGWEDPRFMTFNQAKKAGYKIKKGSKGTAVEFFSPYDREAKKTITWAEASELPEERVGMVSRTSTVFNAAQIEGIPPYEKKTNDIAPNETVNTISRKMGVPITHDGGDMAYYARNRDSIHLPLRENFNDDESYVSTAMHELSHATCDRLGRPKERDLEHRAKEELVAEISSTFMCGEMGIDPAEENRDSHIAYVQSWAQAIENDPGVLAKAIKDAEASADYLMVKGELMSPDEYRKRHRDNIPKDLEEKNLLEKRVGNSQEVAESEDDLVAREPMHGEVNEKGDVWVSTHERNGKTVKGHWRKRRKR